MQEQDDAVTLDTPGGASQPGGLRAFQASLLARMEAASSEDLASRRLAASVGGVACLFNLAEAGEIIPLSSLPALTRVPLTQRWYLGLANIRGNLVGVVDLAVMAGMQPQRRERSARVLAFSPALSASCGLLLTSVTGVRQISDMQEISKSDEISVKLPGVIGHYRDKDGTEWSEIGLASLLDDAAFLHIGR